MTRKIFFYDLETTGLKFWRNGIHQVSCIIDIDGKVVEELDWRVRPNPKAEIDDEALSVGHTSRLEIASYPPMEVVHSEITSKLDKYIDRFDKRDKFFLAGYNNAAFDNQFFRAFFKQCGDSYFGSYFHSNSIDVMVAATLHLMDRRAGMENFKLKTVAAALGIPYTEENLHDALYDVRLTREIFYKAWEG